ncbi:VOC family protein [Janibacter cremeus]|uniref:Catechol 2,3-dioxygenase-like lactoylglutathione lyase family enzyme n=1 Tax=Janibacter cremeus TaxID=1285192 RepID=A0A852VSQ8_9MICO|nr:VOC family protein [Janibacter cremeus]NYF96651.1 catechol 2,3-dioxygenase-like lactoylglutathione lyase family enzyme [Janibacter cremeus]
MLRIGAIVLHVSDSTRGSAFWSEALGYEYEANPDFLRPVGSASTRVHLDENDRTHLDLWTDSAEEQQEEVQRLVSLGAARVEWEYPDDADFVVLTDPAGNLFCVIDTSAE